MPFFYLFLLLIVAAEVAADYYYYGYEKWYIQGSAMLFMVFITSLVFGCGRVRNNKREVQLSEQRETEAVQKLSVVSVIRDNLQ